jgi:polyisoprenyl-teichoic acid--peptidoglycan teichoic acid transferase
MSKQDNEKGVPAPQKKPKRKAWRVLRIVLLVLLGAAIIMGGTYFVLFQLGKGQMQPKTGMLTTLPNDTGETVKEDDGRTVKYKGETYLLNDNIVTILCIGTDNETMIEDVDSFGENGQADAIFLQTIDVKTGKAVVIGISRDAMVDVDVYSLNGNFIRTDYKQICLAYAYGDGKKTSSENVIRSVSRLLYGMPIEHYFAMDLKPIGILNDAVGGVKVKALEDINRADLTAKKGETITLRGDQARTYVRFRNTELLDSNMPRMKRQQQYLTAFSKNALSMTKRDITTPVKLFNRISKHITTNLDASKITYLTTSVLTNNYDGEIEFRMVQGNIVQGEKYAEFIVDETALYEMILDVFYNKVVE